MTIIIFSFVCAECSLNTVNCFACTRKNLELAIFLGYICIITNAVLRVLKLISWMVCRNSIHFKHFLNFIKNCPVQIRILQGLVWKPPLPLLTILPWTISAHEWFPRAATSQSAKPPNPTASATQAKHTLNSSSPPSLCPRNAQRPPLLARNRSISSGSGLPRGNLARNRSPPASWPGNWFQQLISPFSCFVVPFLPSWISWFWRKSFVPPNLDVE